MGKAGISNVGATTYAKKVSDRVARFKPKLVTQRRAVGADAGPRGC
jgi:hypothetical protein